MEEMMERYYNLIIADKVWFFDECTKILKEVRFELENFFKNKQLGDVIFGNPSNSRFMFRGFNYRVHTTFNFNGANSVVQMLIFDSGTMENNGERLAWTEDYAKVVIDYEVNSADDLRDNFKEWLIKNSMEWLLKKKAEIK